MITAHITQQEIMRRAVQDESLSGDSFSKLFTNSASSPSDSRGGPHFESVTGEDLLRALTTQEKTHSNLKRTVHVLSKDLRKTGVSRRHLLRAVMEDERQFKTCIGMPMTLIFASLFIVFFQLEYSTSKIFIQEEALRYKITQQPFEVRNQISVLGWLHDTMIPWLWTIPNVVPVVGDSVAMQQVLVGGVVLRTARGDVMEPCEDVIEKSSAKFQNCYSRSKNVKVDDPLLASWSSSGRRLSEVTSPTGLVPGLLDGEGWFSSRPRSNDERIAHTEARVSRKKRRRKETTQPHAEAKLARFHRHRAGFPQPARRLSGPTRTREEHEQRQRRLKELVFGYMERPVVTDGHVYVKDIPLSLSVTDAQNLVYQMMQNPIMDISTTFFSVEFIIRNDKIEPAMVTHCLINFMFSRGGGLYTELELQTIVLKMSRLAMGILALFGIALMRLTVVNIIRNMIAFRRGAFLTSFFRFASINDALIIVGGWIILAFVILEKRGIRSFNTLFDNYQGFRAQTAPADLQALDLEWLQKIHDDIDPTRDLSDSLMTFVAQYNFLLLTRFLVSTVGHPRLAVLTRTLIHGFQDLIHLIFVLVLVFIAYVLSGHILMGQRMEEFATFKATWGYCLQIVYQHQYDYDRMTEENMAAGAFWIITFIVMLVLVMVNLMLAMIFDNYAAVREGVGPDETIFVFCKRLVTQLRLQSDWISNTDLLVKLSSIPVRDHPTVQSVRKQFPEISEAQLELLFNHAVRKSAAAQGASSNQSFPEYLAGFLLHVSSMRKGLREMQAWSVETPDGEQDDGQKKKQKQKQINPVDHLKIPLVVDKAPEKRPAWVKKGLLVSLKSQQAMMESTMMQMEQMKARLEARGLVGRARFPTAKPAMPDLDKWREAVFEMDTEPTVDCTKVPTKAPAVQNLGAADFFVEPKDASKVKI